MVKRSNEQWLTELGGSEPDPTALADLRAILVRGLRFSLARRVDRGLEALVEDTVQDALLRILDKMDTFRGESMFTTWAQKVAVRVAFSELRRKRWENRSLEVMKTGRDGNEMSLKILSDPTPSPERRSSQNSMILMVHRLIEEELTERQRDAITKVMIQGMPMETAAAELDTNRNALYKLIHDARVKLKTRLEEKEGLTPDDVLAVF